MKSSTKEPSPVTLLYVEDEVPTQELVTQFLRSKFPQIDLLLAHNGQEGLDLFVKNSPDIVVTDVLMPIIDGIQMAKKIKELNKDAHIIILSAVDEVNYILKAIDIGINNYVLKPLNMDKFFAAVERCLEKICLRDQLKQKEEYIRQMAEDSLQVAYAEIKKLKNQLQAENIYLQQEVAQQYNFGEIIGQSSILSRVFSQIDQIAPMNATVLLLGETGTGKGVVARAIHSRSSRKNRPLITVNCTTLPATLIENELFGRERGAFTGSDARQIGRFELADGGTIFLDEIGELPLELQSKLLRVIQDGEFERLGNPRTIKTDVRIIAATNRNLGEAIKNGKFREDLYYRLNVFPITMPPLRQRKDDIALLVNHFVTKFNHKNGKKIETVTKDTLDNLHNYHWPGNVRELESVIERAVIVSQGTALQVLDHFDIPLKTRGLEGQEVKSLAELEHDHLLDVLQKTGWRIEGKNGAAVLLGLNASTLRARMRKYGITRT
jgi:DNA-binding NtrC family response regulator